jgi:ATP-binding cassette, subfamily B, bacterial
MGRPRKLNESLHGLWRAGKYFWPHLRKHRSLIAGSFGALLLEVLLRLLEPWPLKFVFDRILPSPTPANPSPLSVPMLLALAGLSVVLISALRALSSYWNTIGFAQVGNYALAKVRNQLYRHVQFLSLSFHNRAKAGDLVVRMMGDISMLQDVVVTAFMPLVAKVLIMVSMFGWMFWMNWELTLVSLAVLPLFWARTIRIGKRIQEVARKQRQQEGAMAAAATESITSIKIVQAFSLEEKFASAFSSVSEKTLTETARGTKLAASLERSVDLLVGVATALVLWDGARLVVAGQLTPGLLLVFLAYLRHTYRPLQDFAKYTARLAKASAASERVLDLLDRVPEITDAPDAKPAPPFRGEVRFQNVSFAYEKNGRNAMEQVTFCVIPGEKIALVGPSGAGKTTLASLLLRLYDPTSGQVLFDGQDIRNFTVESVRTQIAVVLQENVLFGLSLRDNIAFGLPSATDEEIWAAADLANAAEFIRRLPEGLNTVIGERGVTLSQGQRQRIAIARAAIRRVPILILDEPMTGLDKPNEKLVTEALARLSQGRTTFLITHDLIQAAGANRIFYLEHGRLLEAGSHLELLRKNQHYSRLWHSEHSGITAEAQTP